MADGTYQNLRGSALGNDATEPEAAEIYGLKPTERLFIEKTLLQMYPRLKRHDLIPWKWFNGPLIPDFVVKHTDPYLRRIVEIGCGDGLFSNILSLLFPDIEIIGIDPNRANIEYARSTVSYRRNLKFICANAAVLADIPCDRIVYNQCLSRLKNTSAFKKLIVKTSQWIVDEGDFIIKESPLALLNHLPLLQELFPRLQETNDWAAAVRSLLSEIGYPNPMVYHSRGLPGLPPNEIFYRVSRSLILSSMAAPQFREQPELPGGLSRMKPVGEAVMEWQDWGELSNDSLVGFLFANRQADFTQELV